MKLDKDNYYSPEADRFYMSCSQYQGFLRCEAMQMAKLQGRFAEEPTDALIVGNYVHSYMEGAEAHEDFCKEHFYDIHKVKTSTDKKTGLTIETVTGKYAPFVQADKIIHTINRDKTLTKLREMEGFVEEIMTGEIFGVPWRIRMDKRLDLDDPRVIIDWKTAANIRELTYNKTTKEWETFIEAQGYMMRAAVYSEIEKQNTGFTTDPVFLIAAVSKQDPPDKGLFDLRHRDRYLFELEQVSEHLPHIMRVKRGEELPRKCGRCEYCRSTAGHLKIQPYYILKSANWDGYETDSLAWGCENEGEEAAVADPSQEA